MIDGQLIEAHTVVQATATLDIFNEMTLDPKLVLLPWNPVKGKKWAQKGFHIDNLVFCWIFDTKEGIRSYLCVLKTVTDLKKKIMEGNELKLKVMKDSHND